MTTTAIRLAGLAIGTLCTLTRADREPDIEARVIAQHEPSEDGRTHETHFEPRDPDDALMHGTIIIFGDTLASPSGLWHFDDVVHEPEAEDKPEVIEEPKALALNLPRGAAWLMETAKTLENEAERYGSPSYGTPKCNVQQSLKGAASMLRSAVGHALLSEEA
jgi:hypothetical protein